MMRRLLQLGVVMTAVAAAVLGAGQAAAASAGAEPTLRVSVSSARLALGGSQVVLTGRYVCGPFSPDSDGVVDLTVVQGNTTGYGYLFLTVCDGSGQTWSAPVDSVGGQFLLGRAQASGSGYACDRGPSGGCAFGSFGPTLVRIR